MLLFGNLCLKCISLRRVKLGWGVSVPTSEGFYTNSATFLLQDGENSSSVSVQLLPRDEKPVWGNLLLSPGCSPSNLPMTLRAGLLEQT